MVKEDIDSYEGIEYSIVAGVLIAWVCFELKRCCEATRWEKVEESEGIIYHRRPTHFRYFHSLVSQANNFHVYSFPMQTHSLQTSERFW